MALIQPNEISTLARTIYTNAEIVERLIAEAESMDIRRQLGDALYLALQGAPEGAQYTTLLQGGTYAYNGANYVCEGVKRALAYYVYARIIRDANIQATEYGAVIKEDENSSKAYADERARQYREAFATADTLMQSVLQFLNRCSALFPEYNIGRPQRNPRGGFRVLDGSDAYTRACKPSTIIIAGEKGEKGDPGISANPTIITKSIYNSYLYDVLMTDVDYIYAKAHIAELAHTAGACTSFKRGTLVGRNFDWTFNEDAEFIVRTAGVIGVAHMPGLTAEVAAKGTWQQDERTAKLLPFMLADGVNSHGVFASVHVVDKGAEMYDIPGREDLPALMLIRYILDNFKTAEEAVAYIKSATSVTMPADLLAKGQELQWFIADSTRSYVLENIDGVLDYSERDILTNFHWHGVTCNLDGTLYGPERPENINPTEANGLTPYATGIERYNIVVGATDVDVAEVLDRVRYSHLYENAEGVWYSELVGGVLTIDAEPESFAVRLDDARNAWASRNRETGRVWHSKHSCVYDLDAKTISIVSQDGDVTIGKFPINVALLGFDTADLAQAIAAEEQRAKTVEQDLQQELNTKVTTDEMIQAIGSAQDLLQEAIDGEGSRASTAESDLHNEILAEQGRAEGAEAELSARIDAIVQGRDVRDIVPNYQTLLDYDTTTLGDNDIIMVLLDNTKSDHTTYYRWHTDTQSWEFIGGLAFTYTKTEIDQKFADLHIVLPLFDEHSSQELLEQVDETIRKAGADAQFKLPIPIEGMSGNVTVTYVRYNPANTYLGVFADDRSELFHITRTTSLPRTYTCEVVTKVFASADDLEILIGKLYDAEEGDIIKLNEALEGKADTDLDNITEAGKEVIKGLGGIPDAPADGKTYGRQDKEWVEIAKKEELDTLQLKVGEKAKVTPTLTSGTEIATITTENAEGEEVQTPLYAPNGGEKPTIDETYTYITITTGSDRYIDFRTFYNRVAGNCDSLEWGDGTKIDDVPAAYALSDDNLKHYYPTAGTYVIKIKHSQWDNLWVRANASKVSDVKVAKNISDFRGSSFGDFIGTMTLFNPVPWVKNIFGTSANPTINIPVGAEEAYFNSSLNLFTKQHIVNKTNIQWLGKTVTVGANGDFSTIGEAMRKLSTLVFPYTKGGNGAYIKILSGTVIQEQIYVRSADYGYMTIISEDSYVPVDGSNFYFTMDAHDSRGDYPFIAAEYGATAPVIGCLFRKTHNSAEKGDIIAGIICNRGSKAIVLPNCGFEYFHDGVISNNESSISIREGISRHNTQWGVHARHNGEISARSCDLTYNGIASYADRVADIDVREAVFDYSKQVAVAYHCSRININGSGEVQSGEPGSCANCGEGNNYIIVSKNGSIVNATNISVLNPLSNVFQIEVGGTLVAHGNSVVGLLDGKVKYSMAINTITAQGIIYSYS